MKTCRQCNETKPLAEFHFANGTPSRICKGCHLAQKQEPVSERPPDLQALVERAGRRHIVEIGAVYVENPLKRPQHQGAYQYITSEAWDEHDRMMAAWQEHRRDHAAGAEIASFERSDPEALCICGHAGIYWKSRMGGGKAIWRCEQHHDRWPDYAESDEALKHEQAASR